MKRAPKGTGSIRRRKSGLWEGRYTVGRDPATGKQLQRSLYGHSWAEVRSRLNAALAEVGAAGYTEPTNMTLGAWMEKWLKEYVAPCRRDYTYRAYSSMTRCHIIPSLGSIRLRDLTPYRVQMFYNSLALNDGLSPKTVRCAAGILGASLHTAVRMRLIQANPSSDCILPKYERKEIKPLSGNQITALLGAAKGESIYPLLWTAIFTGMREAELCGLAWDCVDFDAGTITVKRQLQKNPSPGGGWHLTQTKSGRPRVIRAAPRIMNILKEIRQRQDADAFFVFTDKKGGFFTPAGIYQRFKRLAARIGCPKVRFHDIRHTFAVISLQSGDDIKTVQSNLGHATASFTLDIYGHVSDKMRGTSADRIERYIDSTIPFPYP